MALKHCLTPDAESQNLNIRSKCEGGQPWYGVTTLRSVIWYHSNGNSQRTDHCAFTTLTVPQLQSQSVTHSSDICFYRLLLLVDRHIYRDLVFKSRESKTEKLLPSRWLSECHVLPPLELILVVVFEGGARGDVMTLHKLPHCQHCDSRVDFHSRPIPLPRKKTGTSKKDSHCWDQLH